VVARADLSDGTQQAAVQFAILAREAESRRQRGGVRLSQSVSTDLTGDVQLCGEHGELLLRM
jgi:hypothetical protein